MVVDVMVRLMLGLVIGFFIGMTGIGGGVLVLPSLTLILRLPPSMAVGTASLYAFLTKIFASWHHFKLKTIDLNTSLFVLLGAVPADVGTSMLVNYYARQAPSSAGEFQNTLRIVMAIVVFVSAILIIARLVSHYGTTDHDAEAPGLGARLDTRPVLKAWLAVLLGVLVGALIGATSIGGGVIIVPLLMMVFGLSSSRTVGTSIFVAVVLTMVTSIIYGGGAQLDMRTGVVMAIGSLAGVPVGSKLAVKIPERPLQWILSGLILVAAILMLFKQGH